jgi:diguanylate cyclase (GGDEF)-like protein/PAS domain S-box-containing protein
MEALSKGARTMRAVDTISRTWARAGSHATLLLALALFAIVTALRFAFSDPSAPITYLFAVPIAMLAMQFGFKGGFPAAALSLGIFLAWVQIEDVELSVGGYVARALVFCGTGLALGYHHQRLAREATRRMKWFDMSNDMLCEANHAGYFTALNEAWERTLGWTRAELMSRPYLELIHPQDIESTAAEASRLGNEETSVDFTNRYRAKDGSWHWLLWSARSDGDRIFGVAKDITDRKLREEERETLLSREQAMARTDQLTGLPNRRSWDEELRRELERAKREGHAVTIAFLDLDHFKSFNDRHGHPAGDALLRDAADAWRLSIRVTDVVARVGGEEFGILFPHCPPGNAPELLERLRAATPQGQTCSAGIAVWDGQESAEEMTQRADAALYEAKESGRDRAVMADSRFHNMAGEPIEIEGP